MFVFSIFLTSCQQDEDLDIETQQKVEGTTAEIMIMPLGIATATRKITDEYMANATPELKKKMQENARVAYYLRGINKIEAAVELMSHGDFFSDVNFTPILTEEEIAGLQNYSISTKILKSRWGCSSWERTQGPCQRRYFPGNYYMLCCPEARDCPSWMWWAREYREECS